MPALQTLQALASAPPLSALPLAPCSRLWARARLPPAQGPLRPKGRTILTTLRALDQRHPERPPRAPCLQQRVPDSAVSWTHGAPPHTPGAPPHSLLGPQQRPAHRGAGKAMLPGCMIVDGRTDGRPAQAPESLQLASGPQWSEEASLAQLGGPGCPQASPLNPVPSF